ncbi:threonine aldolase [Massilimicrobiota sp. An142]|jgi:threonine aldolase|uniref:threonine aldolase family protein n=1 Tax=Bacillota TaxID=1239 RepID=UPI000B378659|nr:beta-eliminating lyase-related protein [Massilimicrobiota sp. An142]OUQ15148.1 threonine aldolase [Massilimicrobiota sp. An142]HJA53075.1 threonine aldolase [Candidatus Massilimicrobiota merdigallinarum]
MYSFLNDYSEGAHPQILEALNQTNLIQTVGYGKDEYCHLAQKVIKERIHNEQADVHFLVGGTQTNMLMISYALKHYQAVIACDEGHIQVHETGAVEGAGHKILTRPHVHGKVTCQMIEDICQQHTDEHMVQPRMVYISQTTELGTYYTRDELKALYEVTRKYDLYLFLDGARLGSALVLQDAPTLEEIAQYVDAFYIGGTKMGALFGEALVIIHDDLKPQFRYHMKNKGAMLAKGRLLGIQFYELFKDHLYEDIGLHENRMADMIRQALIKKGIPLYEPSATNQIFVDLPQNALEAIEKEFMVTHMGAIPGGERVRIVTSWATSQEAVLSFVSLIENL